MSIRIQQNSLDYSSTNNSRPATLQTNPIHSTAALSDHLAASALRTPQPLISSTINPAISLERINKHRVRPGIDPHDQSPRPYYGFTTSPQAKSIANSAKAVFFNFEEENDNNNNNNDELLSNLASLESSSSVEERCGTAGYCNSQPATSATNVTSNSAFFLSGQQPKQKEEAPSVSRRERHQTPALQMHPSYRVQTTDTSYHYHLQVIASKKPTARLPYDPDKSTKAEWIDECISDGKRWIHLKEELEKSETILKNNFLDWGLSQEELQKKMSLYHTKKIAFEHMALQCFLANQQKR